MPLHVKWQRGSRFTTAAEMIVKNVMSSSHFLGSAFVKYVIWVKIGPIHLEGIKIYPCQLVIIGVVLRRNKKLGQNSKIEIDIGNDKMTTTGSLSNSLHRPEPPTLPIKLLKLYQLQGYKGTYNIFLTFWLPHSK